MTKRRNENTDQCLDKEEGEGAKIEELESGNGQQTGQRLRWLLVTRSQDLLTANQGVLVELELTVM